MTLASSAPKHPEKDLALARKIVLRGLRKYPARVFLFGSRATGRAVRASDIDIAVLPENPLPEGILAELREQLEESSIIYTVDLVNLETAEEGLRERVLKEGIEWRA